MNALPKGEGGKLNQRLIFRDVSCEFVDRPLRGDHDPRNHPYECARNITLAGGRNDLFNDVLPGEFHRQ
jgi:hypothetical protein